VSEEWSTTIPTQELIEMSLSSNENLQTLKDLIDLDNKVDFSLPENVFFVVCELIWLESSVLLILKRDFSDPNFYDEDQQEVVIPQVTLKSLMTLTLAKFHATKDLNSYGYSLSIL
tara:strand:- start:1974 stop:2321 length:348 start_codon:yes stop_codon:yes gene_type:complete